MHILKDNIKKAFDDIENNFNYYTLPQWSQFPDIELYMDQVISLLEKYLSIYYKTTGAEKTITPSMINNYVKLGTIPAPVKKRYSKVHLAYLIIICTLKKTLDMATIQKIIPVGISEEEVSKIYNSFVSNQTKAFVKVNEYLKAANMPLLTGTEENTEKIDNLVMQVASSANIFKILTETLTKYE